MVSSLTRHLYRHCRVTPSSCANSLTSSQVLRRSTAIRWNFREYRFRFTLQPFPCKVCPSRLSHFKGAVQVGLVLREVCTAIVVGFHLLCRQLACEQQHHSHQNKHDFLDFHNSSFLEI